MSETEARAAHPELHKGAVWIPPVRLTDAQRQRLAARLPRDPGAQAANMETEFGRIEESIGDYLADLDSEIRPGPRKQIAKELGGLSDAARVLAREIDSLSDEARARLEGLGLRQLRRESARVAEGAEAAQVQVNTEPRPPGPWPDRAAHRLGMSVAEVWREGGRPFDFDRGKKLAGHHEHPGRWPEFLREVLKIAGSDLDASRLARDIADRMRS